MESYYNFTVEKDVIRNDGTYEVNCWECFYDGDRAEISGMDCLTLHDLINLRNTLDIFLASKNL